MKGVKRVLVFFLSCVLALSTVGLAPMTARAEEGELKCEGFLSAYTEGYEITEEPHTYEFRSKTDDGASGNWDTPLFVVFHSEDGTASMDNQYVVIRSDNWYLDDRASKVDSTIKVSGEGPADWGQWLAENKAGVDCSVTTQLYNNYALVGVSNNGVTATYVVPINPDAKNYVALSGEACTLSNLKASNQHIDLSAAKEKVDSITKDPDDSGDDDSEDVFLTCDGFLSAYTEGYEITEEPHTYEFRSKTDDGASGNWDTPLFVVFHSEDGTASMDNQYVVIRSDNWYLDDRASKVDSTIKVSGEGPADWGQWLAENKAGVDCSVTTQLYNNYALVGVSNNGVTATYVVPINPDAKNYVALSGEKCKLSSLQTSDQHIDLSAAKASVDTSNNDPGTDDPAPAETPTPEVPGTDDPAPVETPTPEVPGTNDPVVEDVETLTGTAWWTGNKYGSNKTMNGDGTWTWTVQASSLPGGYGAFSVEIYDPVTKGYITTGSDMNAWTADGFDPANATITGVPAEEERGSNLVEGHTYAVTVTRSGDTVARSVSAGNTFTVCYADHTADAKICELTITPGEPVSDEVQIHVIAQVGTFATAFREGTSVVDSLAPETTDPGTTEPETPVPGGVFLDCPGWWKAHTEGIEITEELQTYTFHSQTYANATANWNTPVFVVFNSEDRLVKEAGAAGYTEYGVIRSDHYCWGESICETSVVFPAGFDADWDASWAAWQAANRAGVDCTVTTQLYKGYALVGVSNNGITTTYALPINSSVKNYLSLTGELCTLSNLQTSDQHIDLSAARAGADAGITPVAAPSNSNGSAAPAAPAAEVRAIEGGEILSGSAWWSGMAIGSNQLMSGDGTWTWVVQAAALMDGYGAFSVEIYDPATNGYITTGSDMNAWTAEGFDPAKAIVSGVAAELASNLVEGHAYVVTVTRSGNTFAVQYVDFAENKEICNLVITPGEVVSNDVVIHVMAQVGTYVTAFCEGALIDAPAKAKAAKGGEVLKGTEWWAGMMKGADRIMSGDGTWTWTVRASSLVDGYGAFSVEIYDPSTNGYITTGSDKNAWTAEGFNPDSALITGVPKTLDSKLVEGHTYAVTVTRSGNTFTVRYTDHTTGKEICTLVITPAEIVGKNVQIHVMAQVGTFATAFNEGTLIAALGDSTPVALYVIAVIGLAAIIFGLKKRFAR